MSHSITSTPGGLRAARRMRATGLALLVASLVWPASQDQCSAAYLLPESLRRLQSELGPGQGTEDLSYDGVPSPLERAVDSAVYRLIPGDRLHIGIWGENPRIHRIRVSPEGDLIIPDVGPVRVAGITLVEAETRVTSALRQFYRTETVTVRLLELGLYRIAVTGMVASPGMVELASMARLSDALEAAGGLLTGASLRRIVIRAIDDTDTSAGGTAAEPGAVRSHDGAREVDLFRWFLDGDAGSNPLLAPGLAVYVPLRNEHVRVRGPVYTRLIETEAKPRADQIPNRPPEEPESIVEWRQGDTVGRILAWQGGISERATGRAALLRQGSQPIHLDLSSEASLMTPLMPGDLLEVEYGNRWVYVVGSVRLPGRFPYFPGRTALDYVSMAGGATELGRATGWKRVLPEGRQRDLAMDMVMEPGSTIRVPERRTHTFASLLGPLSTATAVVISVIALTR